MGGSLAGLLAARAASDHFDSVTVVERDVLAEADGLRKGVPQAAHAHGLLSGGFLVIDRYFPGLFDELEQAGAVRGDVAGGFLWFQYGCWKLRRNLGLPGIVVSRPALEGAVRRRVRALPNVSLRDGTAVEKPVFDPATQRVTGVALQSGSADEAITAELVIDCTGRGSQSPKWLEEWGYERPEESIVKVDVGYATKVVERRPGDLYGASGAVIASQAPRTRYAAILGAEGNRWVITLAGMLGDYPPDEEQAWNDYAASLPTPDALTLVQGRPLLAPISSYRFPANQRRMYEKMKRFPAGYLVLGDAVCSFNPIYGQGMSAAAMEATALDEGLAGDDPIAERFYARTRKIVDIPWTIATGEDFRYPQVQGKRPPGSGLINGYLNRVHRAASADPVVALRFFEVINLLAPPTALIQPKIMGRVLFRKTPAAPGSPLLN